MVLAGADWAPTGPRYAKARAATIAILGNAYSRISCLGTLLLILIPGLQLVNSAPVTSSERLRALQPNKHAL